MEWDGATRISGRCSVFTILRWWRSLEKVENIYPGQKVIRYECIGHYQKRVGNRLRKLRARTKGLGGKNKVKITETEDLGKVQGKKVKAKSLLTDSSIDKFQNYFGIALRSKVDNVKEMQEAILASMFHVASSEDFNYHTYCPMTTTSYCQHNRDTLNSHESVSTRTWYFAWCGLQSNQYISIWRKRVYGRSVCMDLHKIVMKVSMQLYGNGALNMCILVWILSNYVFMIQSLTTIMAGRHMNMVPGFYTSKLCHTLNVRRKHNAAHHSKPTTKIDRWWEEEENWQTDLQGRHNLRSRRILVYGGSQQWATLNGWSLLVVDPGEKNYIIITIPL